MGLIERIKQKNARQGIANHLESARQYILQHKQKLKPEQCISYSLPIDDAKYSLGNWKETDHAKLADYLQKRRIELTFSSTLMYYIQKKHMQPRDFYTTALIDR